MTGKPQKPQKRNIKSGDMAMLFLIALYSVLQRQ
jgi:hypothetical protein